MGQLPEWYDAVGPGWRSILVKLHEELTEVHPGYNVDQTKEKFGTLSTYAKRAASRARRARRRRAGGSRFVTRVWTAPTTHRGRCTDG